MHGTPHQVLPLSSIKAAQAKFAKFAMLYAQMQPAIKILSRENLGGWFLKKEKEKKVMTYVLYQIHKKKMRENSTPGSQNGSIASLMFSALRSFNFFFF